MCHQQDREEMYIWSVVKVQVSKTEEHDGKFCDMVWVTVEESNLI